MEIGPLVQARVVTIGPQHSLAEAARRMTSQGVGSAVVLTEDGRPGIITERDLLRAVAEAQDLGTASVENYMTANAITASESWDVEQAAEQMLAGNFRHLVVLNDKGDVRGVLSIRDLCRTLLEELEKLRGS